MNKSDKHESLQFKKKKGMLFSGRAYYNLLWLENLRGKRLSNPHWEVMDYRALSLQELFDELKKNDIYLDEESFCDLCQDLDAPEDIPGALSLEEEQARKGYLCGFELWRRLLPERESISLFCDELDRTIASYEKDKDNSKLFELLENMVEILDRNSSQVENPQIIFKRLCLYVAHDLENVIYTFVNSRLSENQDDPALDLCDHFLPYVKEKRALLFLKLKSMSDVFSQERDKLMEYLISSLQDQPNFSLSLALLFYFIEQNQQEFFKEHFSLLVAHIEDEPSLVSLLDVLIAYHQHFGYKKRQEEAKGFLDKKVKRSKGQITKTEKSELLSLL